VDRGLTLDKQQPLGSAAGHDLARMKRELLAKLGRGGGCTALVGTFGCLLERGGDVDVWLRCGECQMTSLLLRIFNDVCEPPMGIALSCRSRICINGRSVQRVNEPDGVADQLDDVRVGGSIENDCDALIIRERCRDQRYGGTGRGRGDEQRLAHRLRQGGQPASQHLLHVLGGGEHLTRLRLAARLLNDSCDLEREQRISSR